MWWDNAVIYQAYPRSYADSNGDGIGDLPGITAKLDHLEWLGVDAVWLSPTFPSPNHDWGYDVGDYYAVHPDFGTMRDLEDLIVEGGRRGIRVMLDLVPNHTSNEHEWFHDPARRDWYVWRDPKPDGSPPSNWKAAFGGSAWTIDSSSGQYYLHNFLPEQPDLDWWNEDVRAAFDDILRFWFERGIAGFRIDVAHALVKDPQLRDNPPARPTDSPTWQRVGQRPEYNVGLPEAVDAHRRFRRVAEEFDPPALLLGETYVMELDKLLQYIVPDGLQLCMNLPFLHTPFVADRLAEVVARTESLLPAESTPAWHASSHDDERFATRWCKGDLAAAKCGLVALLCLRGTTLLYQGDEIAMEAPPVPPERVRDVGGRDPCRTPMVWEDGPGAGFTEPGVEPWLPMGPTDRNVAGQRDDPQSPLRLTRDLIALRKHRGLLHGSYEPVDDVPAGVWAFRREGGALVLINLGDETAHVPLEGVIVIGTDRDRDEETIERMLELRACEAAVVTTS